VDHPAQASDHSHIHDPGAHVTAVEADLEYFRTKRLESRVLHFLRRGIVGFADLLRADVGPTHGTDEDLTTEARIRRVEDELDALVHGIAATTIKLQGATVAIEDTRKERGDYDPFLRLAKRPHGEGSLPERLTRLEAELADAHRLSDTFTRALVATGRITEEQLRLRREELEGIGHRNGARIVARAWVDPGFKQRLLAKGREVVRELDIPPGKLGRLGVAENTAEVHNIVVCTLCSCYPHDLLGNPPWWYRTDDYKQRIVREPRETMRELFGLAVDDDVRVRVHDSTSDVRWMVLPARPEGTGELTEEQLADLVTPESLVGAGHALTPDQLRERLIVPGSSA
jgi:nitrile hydratase subunit alpha